MKEQRQQWKVPPIGQRIVRSVCAVALCFVVYTLRGEKGIPFYSALAALQCMQPYRHSTMEMAKKRTIGTMVGAFWGFVLLILELYVLHATKNPYGLYYYLLVSVFTGVVLYSTVILHCKNNAYFSCVVFLSITVNHVADANPFIFVLNRVVDTLIGVVLALIVNRVQLPRHKHKDTLFVTGVDDTLLTSGAQLTDYSKIELNRMIEEGAQFTVSTIRTPASVRESLGGIQFKLPIIAMDGAVMYDMNSNEFIKKFEMTYEQALRVIHVMDQVGVNYFSNVVVDDLLVIYYTALENEAEQQIYQKLKCSPYRNYVRRPLPKQEGVVYFMVVDQKEKIEQLYQKLMEQSWIDEHRMSKYDSADYQGFAYLRIYQKDANREHMLQELMQRVNLEKSVTFGSVVGNTDIWIENSDNNDMVKRLKQLFEPVSLEFRPLQLWKK